MLAEELIDLKDYAKQQGYSWYTMKHWLNNGLKHLGERPYKTTLNWISEYIEANAVQKESTSILVVNRRKPKFQKMSKVNCNTKFNIEDYIN